MNSKVHWARYLFVQKPTSWVTLDGQILGRRAFAADLTKTAYRSSIARESAGAKGFRVPFPTRSFSQWRPRATSAPPLWSFANAPALQSGIPCYSFSGSPAKMPTTARLGVAVFLIIYERSLNTPGPWALTILGITCGRARTSLGRWALAFLGSIRGNAHNRKAKSIYPRGHLRTLPNFSLALGTIRADAHNRAARPGYFRDRLRTRPKFARKSGVILFRGFFIDSVGGGVGNSPRASPSAARLAVG